MVRQRVANRGRRAPLRKFVWARRELNHTVAASSDLSVDLLSAFQTEYGAQLLGATVVRVRGEVWFRQSVAPGLDAVLHAVGIIVAPDSDVLNQQVDGPISASGIGAHQDWMAFQPVLVGAADSGDLTYKWMVDVKSSRKIEELGETLALVYTNRTAGATLNVRGMLSMGLKLP